jgi:hypothetical protein
MVAGSVIEQWDMDHGFCEMERDGSYLANDDLAALFREREQLAAQIAVSEDMLEQSKGLLKLMDKWLGRWSGLKH